MKEQFLMEYTIESLGATEAECKELITKIGVETMRSLVYDATMAQIAFLRGFPMETIVKRLVLGFAMTMSKRNDITLTRREGDLLAVIATDLAWGPASNDKSKSR